MKKYPENENPEITRLNEEFDRLYKKHNQQVWIDEIVATGEVLATIISYVGLGELVSPLLVGLIPNISFHGLWCIIIYAVVNHVTIDGQKKSKEILDQMYQVINKIEKLEDEEIRQLCKELDSMVSENNNQNAEKPKKLVLSK